MCEYLSSHDREHVEIVVEGHLGEQWAEWFDCAISRRTQGVNRVAVTILTGKLDQAALHGLLAKVRDLGLRLVSVRHLGDGEAEPQINYVEE